MTSFQAPRTRELLAGLRGLSGVGRAEVDGDRCLWCQSRPNPFTDLGTIAAPLKTIQSGVDKLSSGGGSVLLRAGTFYLTDPVRINSSGISVTPYQREVVVVSGEWCPFLAARFAPISISCYSCAVVQDRTIDLPLSYFSFHAIEL
jgi:hypothetical protein